MHTSNLRSEDIKGFSDSNQEGSSTFLKSENFLWERFKSGDKAAFDLIYEQHFQSLCAYGDRLSRDKSLVEDVVQDLFIYLWTHRATLGKTDTIKYYLFLCLRRKLIRVLSQQNKLHQTLLNKDHTSVAFTLNLSSVATEEEEIRIKLSAALQKLTDRQKEAIYLRFYNGLSFKEVADIMDIEIRSVYNLISRSIDVLREEIKHEKIATPALMLLCCLLIDTLL